jgi:hypothetical protein
MAVLRCGGGAGCGHDVVGHPQLAVKRDEAAAGAMRNDAEVVAAVEVTFGWMSAPAKETRVTVALFSEAHGAFCFYGEFLGRSFRGKEHARMSAWQGGLGGCDDCTIFGAESFDCRSPTT